MARCPRLGALLPLLLLGLAVACESAGGGASDVSAGEDLPGPACEPAAAHCEGPLAVSCEDGLPREDDCGAVGYCSEGACVVSQVRLPGDSAPHQDVIEWWYYTGHVSDGEREFGFEVALFQQRLADLLPVSPRPGQEFGYMCHVALLDKSRGEHVYTEDIAVDATTWSSAPVVLEVLGCHLEISGDGHDHIVGTIPEGLERKGLPGEWRFDLVLDAEKEPVHHGVDGVIPMAGAGDSYYYSFTRLAASGTVETPEGRFEVTGQGWMDHQWGGFATMDFQGWDWWSMQLADGWEIMLFLFRSWEGEVVVKAGSLVSPEGDTHAIEGLSSFTIESLRTWESGQTDGVYPLDWDIVIPALDWDLQVRTHHDAQEMPNIAKTYWEGAVTITGTRGGEPVEGVGYVELTGYASNIMDPR